LLHLGLGRGKPLAAVKMMKRRLPFGNMGFGNRCKSKLGYSKKAKGVCEFPRKRGPKGKIAGIFGAASLSLIKPGADSHRESKNSDDEPGGENRLVLCSAKDKFVLNQDVCVMCGALGVDQEGCLIACAQCGQCYHPYCVSIKVNKVRNQLSHVNIQDFLRLNYDSLLKT
jgi:[histone H3]-lysine4 N-trimethyltransferase MLL3